MKLIVDQHRLFDMVFEYSLKFFSYTNTKVECVCMVIEKVMRNVIFSYCTYLVILAQLEKLVRNN